MSNLFLYICRKMGGNNALFKRGDIVTYLPLNVSGFTVDYAKKFPNGVIRYGINKRRNINGCIKDGIMISGVAEHELAFCN